MQTYNKEEVIKEFREKFHNYSMKNPRHVLVEETSGVIEDFLSTALDAAYKAGEEKVKNKIKECVNTCSDDISYLDSNSNNECIRIFKVNLEALK